LTSPSSNSITSGWGLAQVRGAPHGPVDLVAHEREAAGERRAVAHRVEELRNRAQAN
jgi:hypothetical protein